MTLSSRDFDLVLRANTILSSKLEVGEVLKTVMQLATEIVLAEASSILLLDEETNELYFDLALGKAGQGLKQIRLKIGEGLAGWVAQEKKAAIVNEVAKDPRWTSRADKMTDFATRSILAVPLMFRGKLIGVVEAINKESEKGFSEDDRQIFEAFASQAAVAIENARLFSTLRQEKEKLSRVFSEMSDGAVLLSADRKIVLANPAACSFLGWAAGLQTSGDRSPLATGKTAEQVFDPFVLAGFDCSPSLDQVFSSREPAVTFEWVRRSPTELRLTGVLHRLLFENRGVSVGYLLVFRDVTAEKREEMIKRTFLGLISHKLKTPLVPILGYSDFLLNECKLQDTRARHAVETIRGQSLQLTNLVNKLLSFARLESDSMELNLQPLNLSDCIRSCVSTLSSYLQERKVRPLLDESLAAVPAVRGDPELTTEVFKNLIENAAKFNEKPQKSVTIKARQEDGFVCVEVIDDGPGIPPEEETRVFQKFHQVEAFFTGQVPGVGLGLALCKRILESQGGKISLQSRLGQGSNFSVYMPVFKSATTGKMNRV